MAKANQINQVGFQLNKITTEQFAIIPDAYDKSNNQIEMSINLKFGKDHDKKFIASFFNVNFLQNTKPFLIIEVAHHYLIENTA